MYNIMHFIRYTYLSPMGLEGYKPQAMKEHDMHRRELIKRGIAFIAGGVATAVPLIASYESKKPKTTNIDKLHWQKLPHNGIKNGAIRVDFYNGNPILVHEKEDGRVDRVSTRDWTGHAQLDYYGATIFVKKGDDGEIYYCFK